MKQKLNENKLLLISIAILVSIFSFTLFIHLSEYNKETTELKKMHERCLVEKSDTDLCMFVKEDVTKQKLQPTPLLYTQIISLGGELMDFLAITFVLFVGIPSIYKFFISTKSKIYKLELQRKNYWDYFLAYYKKSLKYILILPIFFIITFFITSLATGFDFNVIDIPARNITISGNYATTRWIEYYLVMLFALITHSIFYINITYIAFYKIKNFLINTIYTYILYLISQMILVFIVKLFIVKVFNYKNPSLFSSFDDPLIMRFGGEVPEFVYIIFSSIIYVLFSSIFVYLIYYNKERFVIANE